MADFAKLRSVIRSCPVIDNHAHNLLVPSEYANHPFESITTEATGPALDDAHYSLSHLRAVKQLKELYEYDGPESEWDWHQLQEKRHQWIEKDLDRLIKKSLSGTYSILMDDGLLNPKVMHPYHYHDQFTQAATRRILRIEALAESLMEGITRNARDKDLAVADFMADTFLLFSERFEIQINQAIDDPEVVGFKSIICYRSSESLNVEPEYEKVLMKIGPSFENYIAKCVQEKRYRIDSKHVNEYLLLKLLELLSSRYEKGTFSKPLQLHTGLGDNDISLLKSNPAYLQPLIERYPEVPFVILHSAYPFTREAGYLATVFKNVYLDIGEVFPMLSRDGELKVLRQSLELVPFSKLLWSTDGHLFPETYWLANKQFREVMEEVVLEYVHEKDISEHEAIGLVTAIMFNNANYLYHLQYPLQSGGMPSDPKVLPYAKTIDPKSAESTRAMTTSNLVYDPRLWSSFMKRNPETRFVLTQWLDWMGQIRHRVFASSEFQKLIQTDTRISIAQGNTGTLQNDTVTAAVNTTGQIFVEPDLTTLKTAWGSPAPAATVMCCFCDADGGPRKECARCAMRKLEEELLEEHALNLLVGFEIECVFLKRVDNEKQPYEPLTKTHAWGTLSADQWTNLLPIAFEVHDALQSLGIQMPYFHPESAPGQYEFILPPLPPVHAVDTLYQARQCMATVAEKHGLRVTLHPLPFTNAGGSGAHVHMSLNSTELTEPQIQEKGTQFWASVLEHLQGICAFSLSEKESYGRVSEDHWTGGLWVAWGTQNREVPLRKSASNRWEIRCVDGFANMYLVLGAIMAAGFHGLEEETEEVEKDCPYNSARLSEEQRTEYGITKRLPTTLEEALEKLKEDKVLTDLLPEDMVMTYTDMKVAEQKMLGEMEDWERRIWLIERY